VDGHKGDKNTTTVRHAGGLLLDDHRYTVLIRVRHKSTVASIEVLLDNKSIINWQGQPASLGTTPTSAVPQINQTGIGIHRSITLLSAELRLVGGKATWMYRTDGK
jgi:hypothetical protein